MDYTLTNSTASADTPRPVGLDYAPPGAEHYNWRTDIPADALDAKDFSSIDAWLDACIAQDKAGKIGPGTYDVSGTPRYAPEGIYGYGDHPPTFVADKVDGWLYMKDHNVTLKGVDFQGFGQVLVGAVALTPGSPYQAEGAYAFKRFQPAETGGHGLALQAPADAHAVSPDVNISDCSFVNCDNAFTFVSDTTQMGRVDFNNNTLTGTYGIIDINSLHWTQVYASGNEWKDAVGDRVQPNLKGNGVQTGFKIGTNYYVEDAGHETKLQIVNNYAHNIQSVGTYTDTNAAVFADVRGAISTDPANNQISFNKIVGVQGLKGQEDSNAIYAKAWGLTVQGNYIEASGAAYVDATHNGSEATGILVKPMTLGIARDIQIVGNTLVNMPTAPAGVTPDLAPIKLSEAVGDSSISFNTIIGGGNLSGATASGLIRWFGDYENAKIVGNTFKDVALGAGDNAIALHSLKSHGVATIEVSNNTAIKTVGDYAANTRMVYLDGSYPKVLLTGHNTLDGGHDMLISRTGTGTAADQTYAPPLVSAHGALGLAVGAPAALDENTAAVTKVSALSLSGVSSATISLSDDRFMIKDGAVYLKSGQTLDHETQSAIKLDIKAVSGSQTLTQTVTINVADIDEAPTSVKVSNLASVAENTQTHTLLGDVTVTDPDGPAAFRSNTVTVSDDRFEVVDGHLYLKAGQVVDYEKQADIPLTVTANGAGGEVRTVVDLVVRDVVEATPTPTPTAPAPAPAPAGDWALSATPTTSIVGSGGRDTLSGGPGADSIDGGGREDLMIGGDGDDTYIASGYKDLVVEKPGGGVDTVLVYDNRYFLGDQVENLIAKSGSGTTLVGNDLRNVLVGGTGADTLVGGQGGDLLSGGGGNDTYVVAPGDGSDTITDFGAGDRVVVSGAQFASFGDIKAALHQVGADAVLDLGQHETLTLRGVSVSSLTASQFALGGGVTTATATGPWTGQPGGGTSAAELIGGTDNADYLDGRGGADVMRGGKGDDTYVVDNVGDRILENPGEGIDRAIVRVGAYSLSPDVENLTVATAGGSAVQGNASANIMVGGAAADTIAGGGGADLLTGGAGADVFDFNRLSDRGDTITDFTVGQDHLDFSDLLAATGGAISTHAVSGGLGVFLDHDGVSDLMVTLKGVSSVFTAGQLV